MWYPPDKMLGLIRETQPERTVVGATVIRIAAGDASRLRLIIATNMSEGVSPDIEIVQIGIGAGSAFRAIASLTHQSPSIVLRVEDYGQLILGEIYAVSPSTSAWNVDVSSIVRARYEV